MKKYALMICALALLQTSCASKKSGSESGAGYEVQVQKSDGTFEILTFRFTQDESSLNLMTELAAANSQNDCARSVLDTKKNNIEPTIQRNVTVQKSGDFKVKSSLFKNQFGDALFYANGHQSRYVYFVIADTQKDKSCKIKSTEKWSLSTPELSNKIETLPSISKEISLSQEELKVLLPSANLFSYYISVQVGSDDRFRILLKSDDRSIVGIAIENTVLGFKDLRSSVSMFNGDLNTPQAMPLPFFRSDETRISNKNNFIRQLKYELEALPTMYSQDKVSQERINTIQRNSYQFGGL